MSDDEDAATEDATAEDATATLAELLRTDEETLTTALGRPWFELPRDEEGGLGFVTGIPAQVLIRIDRETVTVGQPHLEWQGHVPRFVLGKAHLEAHWDALPTLEQLADAAKAATTARRRSFRWCRYCRELSDSGDMSERDVCNHCAESVLHAVH